MKKTWWLTRFGSVRTTIFPSPFFRYDPEDEFELRNRLRLLAFGLDQNHGKQVHFVSLAKLVWKVISEQEGIDSLLKVEKTRGFKAGQDHVNSLLTSPHFRPISDEVIKCLDGFDPCKDIVFLVRAGGFAPVIYRPSVLLDELHQRTMVPIIFFYPGWGQGLYRPLLLQPAWFRRSRSLQLSRESVWSQRMKKIRDIFAKPIDRTIEEVIKVEQADEKAVLVELDEYIPTDYLKEQYARLFDEIASGPANPREGIGIWISGFFGSGKSLFAKILGYTVAARKVGAKTASDIFKVKLNNPKIAALMDSINSRIPFHPIIFDVSMDRGVRLANERLTEIIYKALLRELGYSEDFDLAELEITLEGDGKLDAFMQRFQEMYHQPWEKRRLLGLAINEAGAVLHDLEPATYPTADSYAISVGSGRADIDPNKLAKRSYELTERRRPGHALIFIIDEVGQYVSRSVDKMLDLQAIVQSLGVESKNRVEHRQAVSPCWIVVTSQEKLDEVVNALDSKKIELARLQDRFRLTVDLKQSDIAEITAKRILEKTDEAAGDLEQLYDDNEGRINELGRLERTSRDTTITKDSFVRLYPYLPYEIDLCVDIVAGLRLRRGAHRHVGGSNRTIIKQAQELMINPRTRLGEAPLGDLVTLDKVYELLYLGNLLPSEVSREIDDVAKKPCGQFHGTKSCQSHCAFGTGQGFTAYAPQPGGGAVSFRHIRLDFKRCGKRYCGP